MRKPISDTKTLYPNYHYQKPIDNSKLIEKDFDHIIEPDKQTAYEAGMNACHEINEIINNKLRNKDALTDQEKITISTCIKIYEHAMETLETYAKKTKRRSELLTEFGRATHLILAAPKEILLSISVVDLFVLVKNIFELGNTNSHYSLDKVSGMVAILGKRLDEKEINSNLYEEIKHHSKRLKKVKEGVFYLKTALELEIGKYFADMCRQYPKGAAPEEISSRLRAYGNFAADSSAKVDNITDEIREKKFKDNIIPLAFDEPKLQKYFEENKKTINKEIIIWAHTISHRIQRGDSTAAIARDLKTTLEILDKYCDYYFEETYWYQKDEILLNKANKTYLSRLRDFLEKNISIMFDVKNELIKNTVDPDFCIDKDSFNSMVSGKIHEDAAVAWEEFLSKKNASEAENAISKNANNGPENEIFEEKLTFVNIDLISSRNIYSLELTILKLMDKLLEQIDDRYLINKTSINDKEISTSKIAPENAESTQKEESKATSVDTSHTTMTAAFFEEKACDDSAILPAPSITTSQSKSRMPNIVKIESLSYAKNTIKAKDARQMLRPDIYKDDLRKLPHPGGKLYLEEKNLSIGRLWQAEDRRKKIISYSRSIQSEAYTFFPKELLVDLRKALEEPGYTDLLEEIQVKTFLKSGYKEQGIIKIAKENTYEMRLIGGEREYRVLFDLHSIQNKNGLFTDKTSVYFAKEVFFHNGKIDKPVASLKTNKITEVKNILCSSDIYIKPRLNLR